MTVMFDDTNYYSQDADTNTFIVSENAKSGEVTLPTSTSNPKPETISIQRFSDETMEIINFNSGSINAGITRSDWHFAVDSGLVEVNQSFITAHLQSYYSCNLDSLQIIN
jgi:hypothetical protein